VAKKCVAKKMVFSKSLGRKVKRCVSFGGRTRARKRSK